LPVAVKFPSLKSKMMKFGRLSDLVNKAKTLRKGRVLAYSFKTKDIKDYIIKLNTYDQLFNEGVDRTGEIVGYYGRSTEKIYKGQTFEGKQKIAEEPYFFLNTENLFNSFSVVVNEASITIIATDVAKLADVMENPDLLVGLTDESKQELIKEALPIIRDYIIKHLLK